MTPVIMSALFVDPVASDTIDSTGKPLSSAEFHRILEQVEQVDCALKEHFDYNLLSGEGRVLVSAIKNNESMLKVIANSGNFSHRTAYNSIKKLENHNIIKRNYENKDLRRVIIKIDVEKIISVLDRNSFMLKE